MATELTKRTMTLNLTDAEMRVLESLSTQKDLSKTAVIRQALRLYQLLDTRLSKGEKLTLVGFGTFQVRERKSRTGRNPRTGAKLNIPAKKSPVFSAGKSLKEAVAGKKAKVASRR